MDRIEAAQNQRRRPAPRKRVEAELIIEEDTNLNSITVPNQIEKNPSAEDASRRTKLLARALEDVVVLLCTH